MTLLVWIDSLGGCIASKQGNEELRFTQLEKRKNGGQIANEIGLICRAAQNGAVPQIHLAVNVGPGAFTGVKVGVASALALRDWAKMNGINIQAWGVRSLDALRLYAAVCNVPYEKAHAVLDARKDRFYFIQAGQSEIRDIGAAQIKSLLPSTNSTEEPTLFALEKDNGVAEAFGLQVHAVSVREQAVEVVRQLARCDQQQATSQPWDGFGKVEAVYVRGPDIDQRSDWRKKMLGWSQNN